MAAPARLYRRPQPLRRRPHYFSAALNQHGGARSSLFRPQPIWRLPHVFTAALNQNDGALTLFPPPSANMAALALPFSALTQYGGATFGPDAFPRATPDWSALRPSFLLIGLRQAVRRKRRSEEPRGDGGAARRVLRGSSAQTEIREWIRGGGNGAGGGPGEGPGGADGSFPGGCARPEAAGEAVPEGSGRERAPRPLPTAAGSPEEGGGQRGGGGRAGSAAPCAHEGGAGLPGGG